MAKATRSKRGSSRSSRDASTGRVVVGARLGTRQRTRYVKSLKELSEDERFLVKALEEVIRRPHPGTPRERMVKLMLYSERDSAKLLRLRDELKRRWGSL
jgi:hypothetical protein